VAITARTSLGELIAGHPETRLVLANLGIDLDQEDPRTKLGALCKQHGINYFEFRLALFEPSAGTGRDPPEF
jgi:hypothetical protein